MNKDIIKIGIVVVALMLVIIILNLVSKTELEPINAVIVKYNVNMYSKYSENSNVLKNLQAGDNVKILEEKKDKCNNIWYKVECGGQSGYVLSEFVDYYKFLEEEYVLMSDVSKFNIQYETIKSKEDYERFLVVNDINYVYIRAGGRGYGDEGKFYTDSQYQIFIDACEYLGVPYGFYFVDEAIDSNEINEEAEWIVKFVKNNGGKNNVLPFSIDIEKFDVKTRTDDIWDKRGELVEELIDKLNNLSIQTIIYSNAQKASEYLFNVNSYFWLAYYNKEDKIPNYWIDEIVKKSEESEYNKELMNKTIAWQFTESGVANKINEKVDLNLVKNQFFKGFIK